MMKKSTQQSKICPRKKCRLAAFERGSFFFFFYKKKYAKKKKKKKQQKRLSRRRENVSKAAAYTKDSAHTLIFHVNARREPRSWKETERARSCPHSDTQPQTTNSGVLILQSLDLRFKNVSIAFETKVCTNIPVLLAQLLSQWRGNTPMTASFFFFFCSAQLQSGASTGYLSLTFISLFTKRRDTQAPLFLLPIKAPPAQDRQGKKELTMANTRNVHQSELKRAMFSQGLLGLQREVTSTQESQLAQIVQ